MAVQQRPWRSGFGDVARRRGWIVLVCAILGLLAGSLLLQHQEKQYTSTASVLVRGTASSDSAEVAGGRTSGPVNLDTEAQVVRSNDLAQQVATNLGGAAKATDLSKRVTVNVPANTSVLQIVFTAPTAADAKAGAQAYADVYLANRAAEAKADVTQRVSQLRVQAADVTKQLTTVTGRIATLPESSPERALAQAQQSVLVSQLTSLNSRISPLVGDDQTPGRVLTQAALPQAPTSPVPLLFRVSGLALGLLWGVVLVYLLERADDRLRRPAAVEDAGVNLLGSVPTVRHLALAAPGEPLAERFRAIANVLVTSLGGSGAVVVTGANSDASSGYASANLVAALGRSGVDTILLCLDRQDRTIPGLLLVDPDRGLDSVLEGAVSWQQAAVSFDNVRVIAAAGRSGHDLEAFSRRKLHSLVQELRGACEVLVVAAPSTEVSADAQGVATVMDAAVVVVDRRLTGGQELINAVEQFDQVKCTVLGALMVSVPRRAARKWESSRPSTGRAVQPTATNQAHESVPPSRPGRAKLPSLRKDRTGPSPVASPVKVPAGSVVSTKSPTTRS